jgi:hypothetical protein
MFRWRAQHTWSTCAAIPSPVDEVPPRRGAWIIVR